MILVILISVLLGGLATASVGAVRYFKIKRENRALKEKSSTDASPSSTYAQEDRDQTEETSDEDNSPPKVT